MRITFFNGTEIQEIAQLPVILRGEKGEAGHSPRILNGTGVSSDQEGTPGDVYIDMVSGNFYTKVTP